MEWTTFIFVAVVVVSWIASNIKQMQKAAEAAAPPPLPPADPANEIAPRQVDQVQEFLKQIRKRMGEPEPKAVEPLRAVLVEDVRRREPQPGQKPRKKPRKQEADVAPNLAHRRAEVTSLVPDAVPVSAALSSDPAPAVSKAKVTTSPTAQNVVKLLKSPSGLATGFLLNEILQGPVSKRRRGGRR